MVAVGWLWVKIIPVGWAVWGGRDGVADAALTFAVAVGGDRVLGPRAFVEVGRLWIGPFDLLGLHN